MSTPNGAIGRNSGGSEEPLLPPRQVDASDSDEAASTTVEDTASGNSDDSRFTPTEPMVESPSDWTVESTKQLISRYGIQIASAVNENGEPLFWDAVRKRRFDCANVLLGYGKEKGILATFRGAHGNLLSWAIENGFERTVQFILTKLAENCASVQETCDLLETHVFDLALSFPELLEELLQKDKFTVDYARMTVPRSLFGRDGHAPNAMVSEKKPDGWEAMDSQEAKEFWIANLGLHPEVLDDTSDVQVTAVAKFFCISHMTLGLWGRRSLNGLSSALSFRGFHMKMYESETLKAFADYWFRLYHTTYLMVVLLDLVGAVTFTSFALLYGDQDGDGERKHAISIALLCVSCMSQLIGLCYCPADLRLSVWALEMLLLPHVCIIDHQYGHSACLTSLECILQWIAVFRSMRPFDRVGRFISMVNSAFWDALPFMLLGFMLIFAYSTAFVVLFDDRLITVDGESFSSVPHAFETLLHACLGNFDEELIRSSSGLVAVSRSMLFSSFIYVAPIVLLSLLVAYLTDTCDKARSLKKAVLTRSRLQAVASMQGSLSSHILEAKREKRRMSDTERDSVSLTSGSQMGVAFSEDDDFLSVPPLGTYLHFLVPEDREEPDDKEWQGKVVALQRIVKSEARKSEESFNRRLSTQFQKIEELTARCSKNGSITQKTTDQLARMETQMSQLEASIGLILEKLDQ